MTEKEFWEFLRERGAIAVLSRMKARDENDKLNEVCKQAYIKELKGRK